MCLSGPSIICGAVVLVPLDWSCAVTAGPVVVPAFAVVAVVAELLCPWLELLVAGAELVAVLPLFFFAFAVGVVCADATDPAIRNALIQKLAANFRYLFIGYPLERNFFGHCSVHPPNSALSIQLRCHRGEGEFESLYQQHADTLTCSYGKVRLGL
jgi:hypothetical protein